MNSLIKTSLFAILIVGLVNCDSDVESLKKQLFDNDAPILSNEKVVELLKEIKPLLPKKGANKNDIDGDEIDALLEINNFDISLCSSHEKFTHHIPGSRGWLKVELRLSGSGHGITDWNKNIENYVHENLVKQFKICSNKFVNSVNLEQNSVEVLSKIMSNLDKNFNYIDVKNAVQKVIEEKLPSKGKRMFKSKITNLIENEFDRIDFACQKLDNNVDASSVIFYAKNSYMNHELKLDEDVELMNAIKLVEVCSEFLGENQLIDT